MLFRRVWALLKQVFFGHLLRSTKTSPVSSATTKEGQGATSHAEEVRKRLEGLSYLEFPSTKTLLTLAILCLFPSLMIGCTRDARPKQVKQVIVLLLDGARPDRFSSYGYDRSTTPNIDRLANQGVVFFNHFSQATGTRGALPTLLYSRYYTLPIFPYSRSISLTHPRDLFRRLDDESLSLPKALSRAGFLTAAISAHDWLKGNTPFAAEFDELHDLTTPPSHRSYPPAQQVIDYTIDWLEKNIDQNFFLYIHLMDTHFPHLFEAEAQEYFGTAAPPQDRFHPDGRPRDPHKPLSAEERRYLDALYDGSLRYTDQQIGRLLDFLEDHGRLQETLIVITADHGELLMERPGRFEHSGPWFDQVGKIPLIIYYPRKTEPRRIESLTEGVDVYPTVLGLLGITLPEGKKTDGIDLLHEPSSDQKGKQYVFARHGIRGQRYKCLFNDADTVLLSDQEPPVESLDGQLFDLSADPEETRNLWFSQPARVRSLLQAYRTHMRPAYQRFSRAVTHSQPTSPFAITAPYFQTYPHISPVSIDQPDRAEQVLQRCPQFESPSGWEHSNHWAFYFLLAAPGASPVRVEFPLPNGSYLLTATVMGEGSLTLDGGHNPVELQGEPFDPEQLLSNGEIKIGRIEVKQETFRATISPHTGEGCFLLRHFGFEPVLPDKEMDDADEARRERLRSLGYIN